MISASYRYGVVRATVLLLLLSVPSVARAQADWSCEQREGLAAWVDGKRIPLTRERTDRLPYGRDISILVRSAGTAPRAVRVAYELAGGPDGPRSGAHDAVASPQDPTCWAAAVPRIRLNETGRFEAQLFRPARFATGQDAKGFAAAYVLALARMPVGLGPEQFAQQVGIVARTTTEALFATAPAELVVTIDGASRPFLEHLTAGLVQDIGTANILNTAQNNGLLLRQQLDALTSVEPALADSGIVSCRVGETVRRLLQTAAALEAAAPDDLARQVARGELPWPPCALAVLAAAEPTAEGTTRFHTNAVRLARGLVEAPELHALLDVTRRAEALARLVASVRTIDVPVGAELLERYTQLDVVMTYLPHSAYNLVQPFAAATWYFASAGAKNEFAASIAPSGEDRWGLQIGYPVGGHTTAARVTFEPTLMTGLIYRINGVNSVSAGAVTGRRTQDDSVKSDYVFFLSTNLDLSNLGPLQQLFARRDK